MKRFLLLTAAAVTLPVLAGRAEEGLYIPPVQDPTVVKECGACHMVFPPQFLPARSWQALMNDLSSHFGEDASLPDAQRKAITDVLVANAADAPGAGGSHFLRGIGPNDTPLRVSATPYWLGRHDEISSTTFTSAKVKSPANCVACHVAAAKGQFDEPEGEED
ncbi:MAG: diheme cytochrome c [Geminicoccaceae bacterium]